MSLTLAETPNQPEHAMPDRRTETTTLRGLLLAVLLLLAAGGGAAAPAAAFPWSFGMVRLAVKGATEAVILAKARATESGTASYYGNELAGRPTASGERFDPERLTAAHPSLPFGTRLRVTNLRNGQWVVVRVNDRGPFVHQRILDVSREAARRLGMIRSGTARVRVDVLP